MSKFLGDNPATTDMRDKNLILSQEGGKDYIGSWATLLDNLKTDLLPYFKTDLITTAIRPILKTQIGKIIINMDNSKRDATHWDDGVFEYVLCEGGAINETTHPELIAIYGTYLPNFQNATIRHIPTGDTRTLGDYQADALQNLTGSAFTGAGNELFIHGITGRNPDTDTGTGVFSAVVGAYNGGLGMSKNTTSWSWGTFDFDASRVARTADETRMQNIAVQFYAVAQVII